MKSYLGILSDLVTESVDIPFFLLPRPIREKNLLAFSAVFEKIRDELHCETLSETDLSKKTERLLIVIRGEKFDEYEFAVLLRAFLTAAGRHQPAYLFTDILMRTDEFVERAKRLSDSEKLSARFRAALSPQEIKTHDVEIIKTQMPLYALDYFLVMYEWFTRNTPTEKRTLVFKGKDNLPALRDDAIGEDMLIKIVFGLYEKNLRRRMIEDYYSYKKAFLPIKNKENVSDEELRLISESLRAYCLSLVSVCLAQGMASFEPPFYKPFGGERELRVLYEKLSQKSS